MSIIRSSQQTGKFGSYQQNDVESMYGSNAQADKFTFGKNSINGSTYRTTMQNNTFEDKKLLSSENWSNNRFENRNENSYENRDFKKKKQPYLASSYEMSRRSERENSDKKNKRTSYKYENTIVEKQEQQVLCCCFSE